MLKRTDSHIHFQTSGDHSPPAGPTAHHTARINIWSRNSKKNPQGNTNFSYESSLFLTSLSLCINYIKARFHCPKWRLREQLKTRRHFLLLEYKKHCPEAKPDSSEKISESIKKSLRWQQTTAGTGTDCLDWSTANAQQLAAKIYLKFW